MVKNGNDAAPKGLIFELSALHDYGILKPFDMFNVQCSFDIFYKRVFGFVAIKWIAFSF